MRRERIIVAIITICILIVSSCAPANKYHSPYKKRSKQKTKKCNCPSYSYCNYNSYYTIEA